MRKENESRAGYVLVLIGLMFLFVVASGGWPHHANAASPTVSGETAKLAIVLIAVVAIVKLMLLHAPALFGSLTGGTRRKQTRPHCPASPSAITTPDRWSHGKGTRNTQD